MSYPKVIFFNGPPDAGKDTCVKWLIEKHVEIFAEMRMAKSLKDGVHTMLGLHPFAETETYACQKGKANGDFFDRDPRQIYIAAAERFMKVEFGDDVFGHVWLRLYNTWKDAGEAFFSSPQNQIILIPDCGFGPEMEPIINHFGAENIWLVRLYRQGTDYSNDSRGYVKGILPKENEMEIVNIPGQPKKMVQQLEYMFTIRGLYTNWYRETNKSS